MATRTEILACVRQSISALYGDPQLAADLTEGTSLIDDLGMQSLELVVLTSDVIHRYGPVPFQELFDAMAATPPAERNLTIRDLIEFIIENLAPPSALIRAEDSDTEDLTN